jgi:hypothetical protein
VEADFAWVPPPRPSFESLVAASLADIVVSSSGAQLPGPNEIDPYSPWKNPNGFRIGGNNG